MATTAKAPPPEDIPPSSVENAPPIPGNAPDLVPIHWAGGYAEVYNMTRPDPTPAPPDPPNPVPPPPPPAPEPAP